jgi:hypothetical protein
MFHAAATIFCYPGHIEILKAFNCQPERSEGSGTKVVGRMLRKLSMTSRAGSRLS